MADHSTSFSVSDGTLMLTNAILLYQSASSVTGEPNGLPGHKARAFASFHPVVRDTRDRAVIGTGAAMSRAQLGQWAEALGRTFSPAILPGNVLVAHPDLLAWWVPAQVRAAYFALTKPSPGLRVLSERTVVSVPYPAHLLIATRTRLGVYALPRNHRPDADTEILFSPILNVYVDGSLCWGNIRRPQAPTIAAIPEYERAVFDSWSTHANVGQEFTVTGGGITALWDDLAARKAKRFPVRRLKPFRSDGRQVSRATATPGKARTTLAALVEQSMQR